MRPCLVPVLALALALVPTAGAAAAPRTIEDACPTTTPPARFFDVLDDSAHRRGVDCVYHWDIAQGTTEDRYAPARGVTRGQMATFLARLVVRSGGTLPSSPPDAFDDDDGTTHEAATNALAAYGVVSGRGGRTYAPLEVVRRDQMAAFLVRAFEKRTGTVLPAGPDAFDDDSTSTHQAAIDKAAAAGFAAGTGTRTYSPAAPVRRDHMATFLSRVLDKLVEDRVSTAPPVPVVDPTCSTSEVDAALCEFVVALQTGDLSTLRAPEREIAREVSGFPSRRWTVTSCELEGDITVLCEIAFERRSGDSETTSAGFRLQPANGEYDGDGGVTWPAGEELRYHVVEYAGLGLGGTF